MTPEEVRQVGNIAREAAQRIDIHKIDAGAIAALQAKVAEVSKQIDFVPPTFDPALVRRVARDLPTAPASSESLEQPTTPAPANRRIKRPPNEQIARRVVKRHRTSTTRFLKKAGLADELRELVEVETRLANGTPPDCKHAAYSARNLMEGVANCLFPATSETHRDRSGREHSLGAKDHKNRLIAYVDRQLEGQLGGHDFRAFVGTMDAIMRWTGSGPHHAYKLEAAEHSYTRMLDALAVIARAYAAR